MDHLNHLQATQAFANALAQSLSTSFTEQLNSSWELRSVEGSEVPLGLQEPVAFRLAATEGSHGECTVMVDQEQVAALGSKLLGEAPSPYEAKHRNAFARLLSSSMGDLSAALRDHYGPMTFDVHPTEEAVEEKPVISLTASGSGGEELVILVCLDEALLDSLKNPHADKGATRAKKSAIDPSNLQLVMDVELNVSLRFGQCQLPLREVLDLASGSVIELDRDVDDPVELLLDGKVIARGEAVIVDGNYGLRITEIPEPIASHFRS